MNEFQIDQIIGQIERNEDVSPRDIIQLLSELKNEIQSLSQQNADLTDALLKATSVPVELTVEENVGDVEEEIEEEDDSEEEEV